MKNGQSIAQNFLLNAGGKAVNIGILPAFMNAFVSTAIGQTKPGYEFLSNAAFYIIFILVTIMIYFIFNKDKSSRNRASLIIGVLILETFIYSIGLILIYKYKFNNYEGTHLASYGRYMSTFFLMFFLSLFTVMLPRMKDASLKMHQRILPAILSIVLIFTLYMSTPFRLINIRFKITSDALRTAITQSAVIIKSVIKPGDHIYIIWENTSGREYLISKYEIYPAQANISWSIGTPYGDKDIWTKNITVDEWAKMLEGYQYVYIGKSDEQFTTRYGSLFQNGNIQSGSIYTVTAQGIRHILLVPLQAQPR